MSDREERPAGRSRNSGPPSPWRVEGAPTATRRRGILGWRPPGGRRFLIVVVALLTFVIPAGRYDVDANGAPIPNTYHEVPRNPQRIADVFLAPVSGMYGIHPPQDHMLPRLLGQ